MSERALKIGYVVSVSGAKVRGILAVPNGAAENGHGPEDARLAQIGTLVKIPMPNSMAFGLVSALEVRDPSGPPNGHDSRVIEIDLFGESTSGGVQPGFGGASAIDFQRGISVYPSLGDEIHGTTSAELAQIYRRPTGANVCMGTLHQDRNLPVYLLIDELLGKHFAILGSSGAGKSCALTVILRAILTEYPGGHVVLLDPHNEYGEAFGDMAEIIRPGEVQLPFWLLNFEELSEILCSPDPEARESEVGILKEAVITAKRSFYGEDEDTSYLTVDTPAPYRLTTLVETIDKAMGDFERSEQSRPYLRLKARINRLRVDKRFAFMFAGISVQDSMIDIVARILRIPVEDKPISIFDLSGVPSEIVDVLVSLLCRTIFDFALWSDRETAVPVLLACEEAHRYIPRDPDAGFGPTRRAISRIAKEGRKYGVSLALVTQRPSELSQSILSQCSSLFALRMSNDQDQDFVCRALPESAAGMLNALPALRTQEAVVVGEGVALPMRVRFDYLKEDQRPMSTTARFSSAWQREDAPDERFVAETLERWRLQLR